MAERISDQDLLNSFLAEDQQAVGQNISPVASPQPTVRQPQRVAPIPAQQQPQFATQKNAEQVLPAPDPQQQRPTDADLLSQFQQEEQVIDQPQEQPTILESIKDFFTGESRQTEQTRTLPGVLDVGGLNVGREEDSGLKNLGRNLKVAAGLLISFDEKDQMDIIKEAAPETVFTKDEKGNIIGDFEGQKFQLNRPGASFADAQRFVAQLAAFFPAAKFAQLGKGIVQKALLGGIAAAETETAIQQTTTELGGQQGISPERIALAGGLGAAGELATGGVQVFRAGRRAAKVGAAKEELASIAPQVEEAAKLTKKTGVPFFQAQKTRVPSQLEKQSFLVSLPASTRKASESLRQQNKAAADAVDNFITQIAPDEALVTGKEQFRTAAQRAVDAKKNIRTEKTSSIYNKAFSEKTVVDTKPVIDKIDQIAADFPASGEVSKTLGKIKELLKTESGKQPTETVKQSINKLSDKLKGQDVKFDAFHNPKDNSIELSKIIVPDSVRGEGQGTKAMKELIQIANEKGSTLTLTPSKDFGGSVVRLKKFYKGLGFVENKGKNKDFRFTDSFIKLPEKTAIKKGVGAKPNLSKLHNSKLEIDQLLAKFGENSLGNTTKRQVLDIKQTLLETMDKSSPLYKEAREEFARLSPGVTSLQESIIGKVAKLDDIQLEKVSNKIFNPEFSPKTIKDAKKIIDDVDPDAWNKIVKVEMANRLSKMKADITESGLTNQNIPGQIFRTLFGNAKQRAVLFSALDGESAKNLKYLEKALERASLGRVGGSQTALREEIKKELRGGVSQTLRDVFSKPVSTLVSVGDDAAFNKRVRNMSELMFDPNWRPQMKKLRALNPNSPAAARAMAQLLNRVDKTNKDENDN